MFLLAATLIVSAQSCQLLAIDQWIKAIQKTSSLPMWGGAGNPVITYFDDGDIPGRWLALHEACGS